MMAGRSATHEADETVSVPPPCSGATHRPSATLKDHLSRDVFTAYYCPDNTRLVVSVGAQPDSRVGLRFHLRPFCCPAGQPGCSRAKRDLRAATRSWPFRTSGHEKSLRQPPCGSLAACFLHHPDTRASRMSGPATTEAVELGKVDGNWAPIAEEPDTMPRRHGGNA